MERPQKIHSSAKKIFLSIHAGKRTDGVKVEVEKILSFLKNANFSNPLVQFIIRFIRSNKKFLALPSLLKLTSNKKPLCTKYIVQRCISKQETEEAMWP